ncbi:MAG TPA: NAD(P)-dependent alcohol dehydrogenase [Methylophaga aminisulfidivorans]|uniref:NAD(P)-dependent alcohol dehydrogenase n=2 Tax=root TaxID=1 RepID=A0A7C2A616_9GAMM|nr:NAD(P)-dependent alcohol dehydrogenase [Methylophaga aminisulfidivorans]HEC73292.1 NAD(P)-dependent alcohol dehydrogenase [Methylophaga aminisulfidivorans]
MKTFAYAAHSADAPLAPFTFERRSLRENDVSIEILYCGVCHSDLHVARNDWGGSTFPVVPGHEIVGKVTDVGASVSKYKVGDTVAVGCMVDSCQECDECHNDHEQYCRNGFTLTYGSNDRITGDMTQGGYSKHIVVREEFVLRIPESLDITRAAPLLCAGVTTYSPLREWNVGPGSRVGVVGMGGLGHMAIKLAVGLGAYVTVISRSPSKEADAKALGAHHFLISENEDEMSKAASSFDLIIDTVPVQHDLNPYIPLLEHDATIVLVGQIGPVDSVSTGPMIFGRRRVAGSLIGGIAETQEMLDFCARMNILPECEMIKMEEINDAFDRMEKSDVRYRFVIDMTSFSG